MKIKFDVLAYLTMCSIIVLMLAMTVAHAKAEPTIMVLPIIKVIDGDTIKTEFTMLPPELRSVSIRILGIDTPEKKPRAKCLHEHVLAVKASDFVKSLVTEKNQTMKATNIKADKYGGRYDADVIIAGKDVAKELIALGYARPYDGGKKSDWCVQEVIQ
jgi:endonuclease YncB( thermonuclease family)